MKEEEVTEKAFKAYKKVLNDIDPEELKGIIDLVDNMVEVDDEIQQVVNENFWNLILDINDNETKETK